MAASFALVLALLGAQAAQDSRAEVVEKFMKKNDNAVGIAVAVVDGGKSWHYEAGYANKDKKKVKPTTLFRLGSVSKPVAGVLTMSLVEQGKLDLDKPISAYVAGYPDHNGTINLRRLLSHTSGIRHYTNEKNDTFYEPKTTEQALAVFKDDPLLFEPGEKYSYSTHAYTVVVAAIESAAKKSYRDYLRTYISRRCSPSLDCEVLKDSKPDRSALYPGKKVGPVTLRYEKRQDNSWKYGGGGLESNAIDLAYFGYFVANGTLLNAESLKTMWTKQKLNDGTPIGYGLGWDLGKAGFARHSGGQQGCSAYLLVDRDIKVAVAVLCNTDSMPVQQLADDLYVAYMKSR